MNKKIVYYILIAIILHVNSSLHASWTNLFSKPSSSHQDFIDVMKSTKSQKAQNQEKFEYLNYLDNSDYTKTYQNTFYYIQDADMLLQESEKFWDEQIHHIINLLDTDASDIDNDEYNILVQACKIGENLQSYKLLEVFDTHYNILYSVIDNLATLNGQINPEIETLKNVTQSLLHGLYKHLSRTYRKKNSFEQFHEANNITTIKHSELEKKNRSAQRIYEKERIYSFFGSINSNLRNYHAIQNVRGEGNCGYRAFIASVCMNSVQKHDFAAIERFQELLNNNFIQLFIQYAGYANTQYKLSIPEKYERHINLKFTENEIESIQSSLINFLDTIKTYTETDQVKDLFNQHPEFDFFIIMFLRTLLADEFLKSEMNDQKIFAIYNRNEDDDATPEEQEQAYFSELLQWTTWIDDPEFKVLNKITGISINLVQQEATTNAHVVYETDTQPMYGSADILFCDNNHYKIIHPKIHS